MKKGKEERNEQKEKERCKCISRRGCKKERGRVGSCRGRTGEKRWKLEKK